MFVGGGERDFGVHGFGGLEFGPEVRVAEGAEGVFGKRDEGGVQIGVCEEGVDVRAFIFWQAIGYGSVEEGVNQGAVGAAVAFGGKDGTVLVFGGDRTYVIGEDADGFPFSGAVFSGSLEVWRG